MSFTQRTATSLQAYQMLLYRVPLHPEFFKIEAREKGSHGEFEFESWLFAGGHAFRFDYDDIGVTEVVTAEHKGLPERGIVTTMPCAGEKDHEAEIAERITYVTSIQTETLSDHLYLGTYREMFEHGRLGEGLMKVWDTGGLPNLSLVEHQRYSDEVHVQGYHLRSDCQMVLRTQSIFQIGCDGTSTSDSKAEDTTG